MASLFRSTYTFALPLAAALLTGCGDHEQRGLAGLERLMAKSPVARNSDAPARQMSAAGGGDSDSVQTNAIVYVAGISPAARRVLAEHLDKHGSMETSDYPRLRKQMIEAVHNDQSLQPGERSVLIGKLAGTGE